MTPRSFLLLVLIPFLIFAEAQASESSSVTAGPQDSSVQPAWTWLTIGADAFEILQDRHLKFQGQGLKAEAQSGDVVLTRVSLHDIQWISGTLHEQLNRCAGFMVHGSLDSAYRILNRSKFMAESSDLQRGQPSYEINQPGWVHDLEGRIEKSQILATIEHLSTEYNNRYYQHPSGVASATWIRDHWQGLAEGRSDVTAELYSHSGWAQPSVILTLEGSTYPEQVVVLGGHLDSVASGSSNPNFSAPGADDNASGIAVLTEAIRVAMAGGFVPQRTVKFMGYAGEEAGLLGSQEIAEEYMSSNVDVVAVLQLDMTDYNGSVQDMAFLSDYTNNALTTFAKSLIDTYQPELQWTNTACGYGCSDHASWHLEGFPTVMPSEAIFGQHNPWLHTSSDTVSTLNNNADHAYKFARLATALMVEIGMVDDALLFTDGFESGDMSSWQAP